MKKIRSWYRKLKRRIHPKNKNKIFCIGQNKTGTTSLKQFFIDHGYNVAPQRTFEKMDDFYIKRDWAPIINKCKEFQVFQDSPFSWKYTYIVLHYNFPNAKFILSVRDSSEQWYQSLCGFHSKVFGKDGKLPTKEDLMNADYVEKGRPWKTFLEKFGEQDLPYEKNLRIKYYEDHNNAIRHYFQNNPNFLELNVADENSIIKLCEFLNIKPKYKIFPHKNKTNES